jgi:hypothetical protein
MSVMQAKAPLSNAMKPAKGFEIDTFSEERKKLHHESTIVYSAEQTL